MNKKYLQVFLLIVSFILIHIACQNVAQTVFDSATVHGAIQDSITGVPLDSAIVSVQNCSQCAVSDSNGNYQISDIHMPNNKIVISLSAKRDNYNTNNIDLLLNMGDTVTVNIKLIHN